MSRFQSRREFVRLSALSAAAVPLVGLRGAAAASPLPRAVTHVPMRAITRGPRYHWFAYYDKYQFDPTDRYVLSNEVDFEHRTPEIDDVINVGMVDLQDNDRWTHLGETRAWNWQQGAMLQWVPGTRSKVIWNDREGDRFVSHIVDVNSGEKRTIPSPIYTVSPDGRYAMTPDFERIQDMRPGYGYPGIPDPNKKELRPDDAGIYRVDLETGERELILTIAEIAAIPYDYEDLTDAKHYFNHLLFNPDGSRFVFLHRWRRPDNERYKNVGGFGTRMIAASLDGSDVRVLDPFGYTSHFIWRDPQNVLAWAEVEELGEGYYLFKDQYIDGKAPFEPVARGVMTLNGHVTYLTNQEWILNDTYPDEDRMQHVFLYHVPTQKVFPLGEFLSPPEYKGEWRVDTHPRSSRDGTKVVIDSPHNGNGRQLYLLDVSEIVT